MAQRAVNPYVYIETYLDNQQLVTEGWIGGFFKRIGNAWNGFWKNPNPADTAMTRLESAKKALAELQQMVQQNQGAEGDVLGTVLNGLEQSLTIINHIEPTIKDMDGKMQQFSKDGVEGNDPMHQLPDAYNAKFQQIMQARDGIIRQADSEDKLKKLLQNDNLLVQFKHELEEQYQKMGPEQPDKKKLENFLRRIDTDATFREIQALLDFARRRTANGMVAVKPKGYEEVIGIWRRIAQATTDANQQKQQLVDWYTKLPPQHPIKTFIQAEVRGNGQNEADVFYNYAHSWITKYAHHLTP